MYSIHLSNQSGVQGKSKATSQQTESLLITPWHQRQPHFFIKANEHLNLIRIQGQNWPVLMCHLNAKSHFSLAHRDFAFIAPDLQRQCVRALEPARHVHTLEGDGKSGVPPVCLKSNFMSRTLTQISYSKIFNYKQWVVYINNVLRRDLKE